MHGTSLPSHGGEAKTQQRILCQCLLGERGPAGGDFKANSIPDLLSEWEGRADRMGTGGHEDRTPRCSCNREKTDTRCHGNASQTPLRTSRTSVTELAKQWLCVMPGPRGKQTGIRVHSLRGSTLPSPPRMLRCLSSSKDIGSFTFGCQMLVLDFSREQSLLSCPAVCLLRAPAPQFFDLVWASCPTWLGRPFCAHCSRILHPWACPSENFQLLCWLPSPAGTLSGLNLSHWVFSKGSLY